MRYESLIFTPVNYGGTGLCLPAVNYGSPASRGVAKIRAGRLAGPGSLAVSRPSGALAPALPYPPVSTGDDRDRGGQDFPAGVSRVLKKVE